MASPIPQANGTGKNSRLKPICETRAFVTRRAEGRMVAEPHTRGCGVRWVGPIMWWLVKKRTFHLPLAAAHLPWFLPPNPVQADHHRRSKPPRPLIMEDGVLSQANRFDKYCDWYRFLMPTATRQRQRSPLAGGADGTELLGTTAQLVRSGAPLIRDCSQEERQKVCCTMVVGVVSKRR